MLYLPSSEAAAKNFSLTNSCFSVLRMVTHNFSNFASENNEYIYAATPNLHSKQMTYMKFNWQKVCDLKWPKNASSQE